MEPTASLRNGCSRCTLAWLEFRMSRHGLRSSPKFSTTCFHIASIVALAVAWASRTEPEALAAAAAMRWALAAVIGRKIVAGVASPEGRGSTSDVSMALSPVKSGLEESNWRLRRGGKGAWNVPKEAWIGAKARLAYGPGLLTEIGWGIGGDCAM